MRQTSDSVICMYPADVDYQLLSLFAKLRSALIVVGVYLLGCPRILFYLFRNGVKRSVATLKSFVRGAMIMTAAAIIIKLLGSIYTIILQNLIGDRGMGIYQMANPVYSTLLALTSSEFPVAISKYVSEYTAFCDYRNANKIFRVALYMLAGIGLMAMLGLYFLSGTLSKLAGDPRAEWPLKAIAPALFFVPILFLGASFWKLIAIHIVSIHQIDFFKMCSCLVT